MTSTSPISRPKAVVVGVGPENGLGGALCKRFAQEGHHVFIAGRTREKLERIAQLIQLSGGRATPVVCDATEEQSVIQLFEEIEMEGEGELDLAVYNVGNSTPGNIREMDADYFKNAWHLLCFGGFLVGREMTRRIPRTGGTLIYTGASASLRGRPGYAAFNSGKSALRTFAQALAKEYGAEGLHVGHVIIDGGIGGDKWLDQFESMPDQETQNKFISLEGLADTYWNLYKQEPRAWTFEMDLRTSMESW
jgi:NAD(P)-dependent dehydrogenase (short-subunit alcohol dehydrogenase family)